MNTTELMKIFDFILENTDELFKNKIFNHETLKTIRKIAKGQLSNDFELTEGQRNLLIETFIQKNGVFDEDTPQIILEDAECIKLALKNDVQSVNYLQNISSNANDFIVEQVLKRKYVLSFNSPAFLKTNLQVVLNSIDFDVQSADYVDWYSFPVNIQNELVDKIIQGEYEFSHLSHSFLRQNSKIALIALKKNIDNYLNIDSSLQNDPLIFRELVLHGNYLEDNSKSFKKLKLFSDSEVFSIALKCHGKHRTDNELYIERFNKIYNDAINSKPHIKDFHLIFDYVAEEQWKKHKKKCSDEYNNIFGKICAELRQNKPLREIFNNLGFLGAMQKTLGKKYNLLEDAMAEYYKIYHSECDRKYEKLEKVQNLISDLSSLYIAKSKETFKQLEIKKCYKLIREFYQLDLDNPYIYKLVSQASKKEKFRNLYMQGDNLVHKFISELIEHYSRDLNTNIINPDIIKILINGFVVEGKSKLEDITFPPTFYEHYTKYKKVLKLIKRLNIGNIRYDGVEVEKYRDLIVYDEQTQKYLYSGKVFTEYELNQYKIYEECLEYFERIKQDIACEIQKMEFDGTINKEIANALTESLPFTDEYFIFNSELLLNTFTLNDLIRSSMRNTLDFELSSFTNEESYRHLYHLLVNKAVIVLLLILSQYGQNIFIDHGINKDLFFEIINNMNFMVNLANDTNLKMNDFNEFLFIYNMLLYGGQDSIALIGQENIEKLCKNQIHSDIDFDETIKIAKELISKMAMRTESTVPYVSGRTTNYKYSLYDSQDTSILTAGVDTDSCFEIGNADNDFLHYCALDKNGFIIKIADINGNFIARAAGFRNGNSIYLNQLRTIYDETRFGYCGNYESEKQELIDTLKAACEDIIESSHQNEKEATKIEYVFITASFIFNDYDPLVPEEVELEIGEDPMDNLSEDWISFCQNTKYLYEAPMKGQFTTDYETYQVICLASHEDKHLKGEYKLVKKDVPALYKRTRNRIFVTDNIDSSVYQRINKIRAVEAYLNESTLTQLEIPKKSLVMIGDNWYLAYKDGEILSSCVLDFDDNAKLEFESALRRLSDTLKDKFLNNKVLTIKK